MQSQKKIIGEQTINKEQIMNEKNQVFVLQILY